MLMRIPAGQFKAKCLQLMDDVRKSHNTIVITKHGVPVAKLVTVDSETDKKEAFGCMKGTFSISGDVMKPVGEKWDADHA